ncbi:MAG: hypothetical protein PHY77_05910 [Desulfotomaculaceae bacterium]|nr:hypothetical protein [Desulfotomaculaceae bacterium]
MFSSHELDTLLARIASQLGMGTVDIYKILSANSKTGSRSSNAQGKQNAIPHFSPQKALVILGLLVGSLEVKSILIGRDQIINILLEGSLKRKTKLDNCLDEIGSMPFDEVLRAVLGRI